MLTPFDDQGTIDWGGLEALIDWYLEKGAEGLFAVCQSSEMQFLSLAERTELARFTVKAVSGRDSDLDSCRPCARIVRDLP